MRASSASSSVVPGQIDAAIERGHNRCADRRVGMTVDAGGELAQEIDVFVPVGVPHAAAVAPDDAEREWIVVEDGPGVAARHDGRRRQKTLAALRIRRGERRGLHRQGPARRIRCDRTIGGGNECHRHAQMRCQSVSDLLLHACRQRRPHFAGTEHPKAKPFVKRGVPGNVPESTEGQDAPPGLGLKTDFANECPADSFPAVLREDVQFFQVKAVAEGLHQGKPDGRRVGASDPKKTCALRDLEILEWSQIQRQPGRGGNGQKHVAGAALDLRKEWHLVGLGQAYLVHRVTLSAALKGPPYKFRLALERLGSSSQSATVPRARSALRPAGKSPRAAASTAPACRARR